MKDKEQTYEKKGTQRKQKQFRDQKKTKPHYKYYTHMIRDLSFKKQEQHAIKKEAIQEEIKTHLKLKYNIK